MRRVSRIAFYGLVILIFAYLLFPILIVIPLSFSSGKYLTFPPPGFSLQWYANFFARSAWTDSAWLSIWVGLAVTALSTLLGTPAAIGLVRGKFAGKKLVNALILSPVIAPGIIVAIGLYFAYASYGLVGRPLALVLGHTALAVPFVVINVSSTLYGVDRRLEYAALSLGASPWATFRQSHSAADPARHLRRRGLRLHHLVRRVARRAVSLRHDGGHPAAADVGADPLRYRSDARFGLDATDHDHDQPDGRRRTLAPPVRASSHRPGWPIVSTA